MTDKEKLKIILQALKFYADEKNWSDEDRDEDSWIFTYKSKMLGDFGKVRCAGDTAREAILKIKE